MSRLKSLPLSLFLILSYVPVSAQMDQSILTPEFLEGLPASVRDQIAGKNQAKQEEELEILLRSDTSIQSNKKILEALKKQIIELESRIKPKGANKDLSRFGDVFFSSLQSSFMPINVPNMIGEYIVDVGDTFNLILTGMAQGTYEIMVQRDGSLILPEIGKVYVAGNTLENVDKIVTEYVNSSSLGVTTFLNLSKVRDMQILMLGGVDSPGIYTLSGGSNVLGALNVAGGIASNGSYRKIDVKRDGEVIESMDLYDTFVFGKSPFQSSLRSGDIIFVHPISFQVPITGGVNNPAIYEILRGETLSEALIYAGGFNESFVGHSYLNINRFNLETQTMLDVDVTGSSDLLLEPRDSILVPSYKNVYDFSRMVTIEGMVERPGTYFISENEKLSSLINRAGGYKSGAYIYGSALFREEALKKEKLYAQLNYSDTINYIVSNIGKPNISINSSAIDLLAEELRSRNYTGRIITEFSMNKIDSSPSLDTRLEHQDKIFIPSMQKVVYLFGEFKNPSNVLFDSSLNVSDYIDMVGGVEESAFNELLIIDPDGKTHIYNRKNIFAFQSMRADIYPGSIIYAPRDIGKLGGITYASSLAPILSSLAISLASLNSINN
ncbi:SLBB domain-containing protein [Gammaproteobacteria bacterium]|nr:SLBB domain-containing protein [Gammaproteobacteria bacterium]